jgi:hypothetical protein
MSTAAVSSDSLYQQLQSFYQQRQSDVQQLGQALQSGNLASAQQAFNAIQTLGQSGPFASGDPFRNSTRESDFSAIGQALQSGDLAGAQTAFAALQSTFHQSQSANTSDSTGPAVVVNLGGATGPTTLPDQSVPSISPAISSTSSTSSTSGPEIIINLPANSCAGEQLTIGVNNTGSGTDQLTISLGTQQNPSSQDQITLNLNANSNEQIVLNLLNGQASSSSPNSSGLSVVA